jgi:hypothetical protein
MARERELVVQAPVLTSSYILGVRRAIMACRTDSPTIS